MHPTRRPGVPAAALVLLAAGLGAPAPAIAAGPPTWAGTTKAVFGGDSFVVGPVSDGRRLWTLELPAQRPALLRSRSIRTGRLVSSVRVEVPRSASATVVGQSEEAPAPQLVIGRKVGAVTGTWCDVEEEERGGGAWCLGARSFYARFSLRTGRARDGKLTAAPRELVGGDRPTELVRRPGRRTALRDVVTRRTVLTAPGNADDFEGAGRFVAWKVGSSRWGWDAMRVVERDTGRRRYSLPLRRIMDAVGRKTGDDAPWPEVATLAPGGTVDLHVFYYAPRVHPVFVDERGRVRRLEATFRDATAFTTRVRGGRVLVSAESDGDPGDGCVRTSSWLTDRTGRVGTTFRTVRATKRLRLANDPVFVSPTAILWGEQDDNGGPFPYRYRVLPDARDLTLTTGGRPAC